MKSFDALNRTPGSARPAHAVRPSWLKRVFTFAKSGPLDKATHIFMVVLIGATIVAPLAEALHTAQLYDLKPASRLLEAPSDQAAKIHYDQSKRVFQFNKEALSASNSSSGDHQGVGTDKGYAADFSEDSTGGVTIHDPASKLQLSFKPAFKTLPGKLSAGRMVYPLESRGDQLIYTPQATELKEDIVLAGSESDGQSFTYQLELPDSLEARLLPSGAVGFYSADSRLFGDISYGSEADQKQVEEARKSAAKTNLVFAIPAPVIKESNQQSSEARAKFELKGTNLTVLATGLKTAHYPISIDPSFVVASIASWQSGNDEGNVDFDISNNRIKQGALTGGAISNADWQTANSFATARYGHASVVYNGYIYVMGGCSTSGCTIQSDIQYAKLSTTTGAVLNDAGCGSAWCTNATALPGVRTNQKAVVYNGYLYTTGGCTAITVTTCNTRTNEVQYAPINSNGTIGAWTLTTSFSAARTFPGTVVYNGYMYIMGGYDGSTFLTDVQYAPIKANGSVGTWTSNGNSFATGRAGHGAVVYNGYVYVVGGCTDTLCTAPTRSVQYAPIKNDGSVGVWKAGVQLPAAVTGNGFGGVGVFVQNGFLYLTGGYDGGGANGYYNTIYYSVLQTDGTNGLWDQTWALLPVASSHRNQHSAVTYNGYIYVMGGVSSGAPFGDTQFAKIAPAGSTGAWYNTGTTLPLVRRSHAMVANNGYLYLTGGCSSQNCLGYMADVTYTSINSNGSTNTWTNTTSFNTARYYHTSVVYNNYLYVIGGCSVGTGGNCNNATGYRNDVQYAKLNASDGNIAADAGCGTAWCTTSTFPTARFGHASVVNNGYVYIFGGCSSTSGGDCTNFLNDVQYAKFGTAGALASDAGCGTAWCSTTAFTTSRINHAIAAGGGYVYIVGGCSGGGSGRNCSTLLNDVRYAKFGTAGALASDAGCGTAWCTATSFTTARNGHAATFYKGSLYVWGGCSSAGGGSCSQRQSDLQFAAINSTGNIGTWTTAEQTTLQASNDFAYALEEGYLFMTGGSGTGGEQILSQVAEIKNGGLGYMNAWTGTSSFTTARTSHTSVAYNGYLYIMGGDNGTNTLYNDIQYAPINVDGTLGVWSSAGSGFTTARTSHTTVINNGYLYVMGGCTGLTAGACTAVQNNVQYAKFGTAGALLADAGCGTAWCTTTAFTTARTGHTSIASNGYVYVMGGCTNASCSTRGNDMQYAKFGTAGALLADAGCGTAWCTSGSYNFTTARAAHASVINNGYAYILGGYSGTSLLNDVQFTKLSANGVPSDPGCGTVWCPTTSFATARNSHVAVAANGHLYLGTGLTASYLSTNQWTQFNANGTVGNWAPTTSITTGRAYASIAYGNGFFFLTGGYDGSVPKNDTQTAGQQGMARIARYSKLFAADKDVTTTKAYYLGTLANGAAIILGNRSAPSSTAVFGSNTSILEVAPAAPTAVTSAEKRYNQFQVTIDDSYSSVFPDTPSVISRLELYYHPNPSQRLRGGKTFTGEVIQSLDASP